MFFFARNQVDGAGEQVRGGFFQTVVVDPQSRVGYTTAESRFGVRFVLDIAVAPCRSAAHIYYLVNRASLAPVEYFGVGVL